VFRNFLALARTASTVLLLGSFTYGQQSSDSQPLGDVARDQKESKKHPKENGKTEKVLTNTDLTSGSAAATSGAMNSSAASAEVQDSRPTESKSTASKGQQVTGSVLDRPKDSAPDVIVVPAGTELRVDIGDRKIVVPVRVGFSTPIPALSKVTVLVTHASVAVAYPDAANYSGIANVDYAEYATVTAVTVDGKTYELDTDSVPLFISGTNSEVTFTLSGPVEILR
jgi:hypothetical protein